MARARRPGLRRSKGSECRSSASRCAGTRWRRRNRRIRRTRRIPLRLVDAERGARRGSLARDRRRPPTRRGTLVVERRQAVELRADTGRVVRCLRDRGRARVPLGPEVPDLERAEPGALAPPDLGASLRDAASQPRLHRDPRGDQRREGRRRGHSAAGLDGASRRLPDQRHARAHARLDVYAHNPYPLDPSGRLRCMHQRAGPARRSRWRRSAGSSGSSRAISRALDLATEYGYQSNPPDRSRREPITAGALRGKGRMPHTARRASTC